MINLNGRWDMGVQFIFGEAQHHLQLKQVGQQLSGTYHSKYSQQPIQGMVTEDTVRIETRIRHQAQSVTYLFEGKISGDEMEGKLTLGEYWHATWKSKKTDMP